MSVPLLFRKRFIPNELIPLKNDIILVHEKNLIITKWLTLHPRTDIAHGISAFYMDKGYKISKIYNKHDQVVYWYCDIIQTKNDPIKNTVLFEDLLIDVILYEDGRMRIVDLDELCEALRLKLISQAEVIYALQALNSLLEIIYQGHINTLQAPVNQAEKLYCSNHN
jgi:predicted RNA-binding protein associated with RNAse of E/G family